MAQIINLRQARKKKTRADKDQKAQENRVRFGRTKAEKRKEAQERDRAAKAVDGGRLSEDETDVP